MPHLRSYGNELFAQSSQTLHDANNELFALIRWIFQKLGINHHSPLDLPARVAPSFVTRCESEFLSLSAPRFAVRLQHPALGYVNLRRLAEIERMFRARTANLHPNSLPSQLRPKGPIADGLLRTEAFAGEFHLLTVPRNCGSAEGIHGQLCPYVGQLDSIGGGECAECVVMMVSQIMHRYVERVHGVAEVNASLLPPYLDLLNASGLTIDAIVAYLTNNTSGPGGLSVSIELPQPMSDTQTHQRNNLFRAAIDVYLKSGFPVILPVDLTRMNKGFYAESTGEETGIYQANGVPDIVQRAWSRDKIKRPHAVLAVGTKTTSSLSPFRNCSDHEFLINDPATVPFLRASSSDIEDVIGTKNSLFHDSGHLQDLCYIPVVPAAVKMPLHVARPTPGDRVEKISAIELAYLCQRKLPAEPGTFLGLIHDSAPDSQFGAFRLFSVDELKSGTNNSFFVPDGKTSFESEIPEWLLKTELPKFLSDLEQRGANWVWMHYTTSRSRCAVFYDAQCDLSWSQLHGNDPDFAAGRISSKFLENLSKALIGCISENKNGLWQFNELRRKRVEPANSVTSKIVTRPQNKTIALSRKAFLPGLISSFDAECQFIDADYLWWPSEELHCEFYCFMQSLISRWMAAGLKDLTTEPHLDAVKLLSLCTTNGEIREFVTNKLIGTYRPHVRIYALASFFQELSSDDKPTAYQGMAALQGLVTLAIALKQRGHPVRTVEIVCGSRVQSVARLRSVFDLPNGRLSASHPTVATLRSSTAGVRRLVLNIKKALSDSKLAISLRENNIKIVLEAEPGALNVLNSADALWSVVKELNATQIGTVAMQDIVALNLDVAHFRQAGITEEDVANLCSLRQFAHIHVSGFDPKGHFGDQMFTSETMITYPGLFDQFANQCPIGCSMEFEAAASKEDVQNGVTNFLRCFH